MRPVLLLLVVAVVAALACHGPHAAHADAVQARRTARTDVSRRLVEAEERVTLRAVEAAERSLDPDAVLAFIAPDFVMVQDGRHVDYDATVEQIRSTLPTLRAFEPHFDEILVFVLDADTALTTLIFRDEVTDADGNTLRMWGPSTMLWLRRDGRWQIAFADSDHYPVDDVTDG